MKVAVDNLQRLLKQVDVVLEVRDARLPFSSANDQLDRLLVGKRRICVLNKGDIADGNASHVRRAVARGCAGRGHPNA
jgi:ribosome biogenesis GTPase A